MYAAIINARNSLYEKGAFKSRSLGAKTISVGNITVGGTGKTPLVAFIAEILIENGERVGILSRGYGREKPKQRVVVSDGENFLADARTAGDEPFELAAKLSGKVVIVADANRVAAGNWARRKFKISTFVLDDAFQHRRVRRDLDIVCVDATNPFGSGKTLPSGILREPLKNLSRAEMIVITRANLAEDVPKLKSKIKEYNPHCPIFVTENKISNLIELEKFPATTQSFQKPTDKCLAFCALGNSENFFEQLRRENFNLSATRAFPDHHFYTPQDLEKISEKARQCEAKILLTTAKDAVKLKNLKFDIRCLVVETRMVFDDEDGFRKRILEVIGKN